jgi:hypothetical protein
VELPGVADRGDERGRDQRTNPFHLHQASCSLITAGKRGNPQVVAL